LPEVDLVIPDAYDSVYKYGETRFADNDYSPALESFKSICDNDTTSKYYLRSSYAAGWIYENVLNKPDSAVKYYSKIVSFDPKSEICKHVTEKLTLYKENIQEKEDSLKRMENNTFDSLKNQKDTLSKGTNENKGEIKGNNGENPEGQNGVDNSKEKEKDPANNTDIKKENEPTTEPDNSK
jgi:tetratricopeptide (TPR) repeat protein